MRGNINFNRKWIRGKDGSRIENPNYIDPHSYSEKRSGEISHSTYAEPVQTVSNSKHNYIIYIIFALIAILVGGMIISKSGDRTVADESSTMSEVVVNDAMIYEDAQELLPSQETEEIAEPDVIQDIEQTATSELDQYEQVFLHADQIALTEGELYKYNLNEVQLLINGIYAKHGRSFEKVENQDYFGSKQWYSSTNKSDEEIEAELIGTERANMDLLMERRELLQNN